MAEGFDESLAILIEWDSIDKKSLSLEQLESVLEFFEGVTIGTATESEVQELIDKKAEELLTKSKS